MKYHATIDGETAVCGAGRVAFAYQKDQFFAHYAKDMECKNCSRMLRASMKLQSETEQRPCDWQPSDAWSTMLLIDKEDKVSLYDFLRDNWAPNVEPISEDDMRRLFSLKVGELTCIGFLVIQRIG